MAELRDARDPDGRKLGWRTTRQDPFRPPERRPKFAFGAILRRKAEVARTGDHFIGAVDGMYADFEAACAGGTVSEGWWAVQEDRPSTRDQVFYSLVAPDGDSSILAGEAELEEVPLGKPWWEASP